MMPFRLIITIVGGFMLPLFRHTGADYYFLQAISR